MYPLGMAYGQETLVAFFLRFIKKFEKKVGVNRVEGTATSYKYACSHLMQFLNKEYNLSDIPFTALDRSFIDKYDLHLRTDCRLGAGTILHLTTLLMTVIRRAKSAGILTSNPFAGYEAERPAREIKYLTEQELERIMSTPLHNRKLYISATCSFFLLYRDSIRGYVPLVGWRSRGCRGRHFMD